jgi:hypothetical protein
MKDELSQLREILWRRKFTGAERKALCAEPEISAELELESRLSETLAKIPDAAVPSNFTACILKAVELEESRSAHQRNSRWNWHAFLPRVAVVAVALVFAGLALHHHELYSQRAKLAQNVALVAESQPLPSVDALKNFDAIQRMSQPRADEELLALMQ